MNYSKHLNYSGFQRCERPISDVKSRFHLKKSDNQIISPNETRVVSPFVKKNYFKKNIRPFT